MRQMRCFAVSALVLSAVLCAAPAFAQIEPTFRTRFGIAVGGGFPIDAAGKEGEPGGVLEAQIGVGDDPLVVSLAFGYSTFGGVPLEEGVAVVNQFEMRTDWCPTAPEEWALVYQFGGGVYRMDRYNEPNEDLRFGVRAGLGLRWSPAWHTNIGLITAYNFAPDLEASTRHWVTLGVELLRWSD